MTTSHELMPYVEYIPQTKPAPASPSSYISGGHFFYLLAIIFVSSATLHDNYYMFDLCPLRRAQGALFVRFLGQRLDVVVALWDVVWKPGRTAHLGLAH